MPVTVQLPPGRARSRRGSCGRATWIVPGTVSTVSGVRAFPLLDRGRSVTTLLAEPGSNTRETPGLPRDCRVRPSSGSPGRSVGAEAIALDRAGLRVEDDGRPRGAPWPGTGWPAPAGRRTAGPGRWSAARTSRATAGRRWSYAGGDDLAPAPPSITVSRPGCRRAARRGCPRCRPVPCPSRSTKPTTLAPTSPAGCRRRDSGQHVMPGRA